MATYKLKNSEERHVTVDGSRLDKLLAADDRYTKLSDEQAESTLKKALEGEPSK